MELAPEDWWYVVLDDAELFAVEEGDKWDEKVYDALPELAVPRAKELLPESSVYYVRQALEWLTPDGNVEEEHLAEAVRSVVRTGGNRLVLMDQEAFDTGLMGLLFRDGRGNVICQVPIEVDDLGSVNLHDGRGDLDDQWFWIDAEVGEKYRVGGEVVQQLVDVIKATYL